mmetsp:Transcript_1769/g.3946  ORF Transcript_1769/g.3946 Transcript_1769/m.3946 type:complete len:81 (+) Transcript_1769:919-1161(+)
MLHGGARVSSVVCCVWQSSRLWDRLPVPSCAPQTLAARGSTEFEFELSMLQLEPTGAVFAFRRALVDRSQVEGGCDGLCG